MARPSGIPKICAMELPVATMPIAVDEWRGLTTRAATTITMDQKTACAVATTSREQMSSR